MSYCCQTHGAEWNQFKFHDEFLSRISLISRKRKFPLWKLTLHWGRWKIIYQKVTESNRTSVIFFPSSSFSYFLSYWELLDRTMRVEIKLNKILELSSLFLSICLAIACVLLVLAVTAQQKPLKPVPDNFTCYCSLYVFIFSFDITQFYRIFIYFFFCRTRKNLINLFGVEQQKNNK